MFICEIWLFHWYFPQFFISHNLICRSTDISQCFRGSLRLQDNESRLYMITMKLMSRNDAFPSGFSSTVYCVYIYLTKKVGDQNLNV